MMNHSCFFFVTYGISFGTIYVVEDFSILDRQSQCFFLLNHIKFQSVPFLTSLFKLSIYPLGPPSVQSIGAASAVSLAVGHNPGRVPTALQ